MYVLDAHDSRYDHICKAYTTELNQRKLDEIKNWVNKLLSPHSSVSTQSITPVKRASRFERLGTDRNNEEEAIHDPKAKRKCHFWRTYDHTLTPWL
jgi:hypothetical protein